MYISTMGSESLKYASQIAILNSNYLKFSLQDYYTIKDVIQKIIKIKNYSWSKLIIRRPDRKGKDKNYYLNCKKTQRQLKWNSKTNLENGLKKTINYYDSIIKKVKFKDTTFDIK